MLGLLGLRIFETTGAEISETAGIQVTRAPSMLRHTFVTTVPDAPGGHRGLGWPMDKTASQWYRRRRRT